MTRYATDKDIPEIVRIINSAFRVEDFFIDGDRTNAGDITARMADPDTRILVVDAPDSGTLAAAVVVDVHEGAVITPCSRSILHFKVEVSHETS
jgi:hypothetical protein